MSSCTRLILGDVQNYTYFELPHFFVTLSTQFKSDMEAEAEKRKQRLQALRKRKLQSSANDQTNGEK